MFQTHHNYYFVRMFETQVVEMIVKPVHEAKSRSGLSEQSCRGATSRAPGSFWGLVSSQRGCGVSCLDCRCLRDVADEWEERFYIRHNLLEVGFETATALESRQSF